MFWKSIGESIIVLGHWQVWVACLLYIAITIVYLMFVGGLMREEASGGRMATGCLFYILGGPVLQGILLGLIIAFLLPIFLGQSNVNPVSVVMSELWPLIKVSGLAILIVTLLCVVPLVGMVISKSPGIQTFLEGVIIFRIISTASISDLLRGVGEIDKVYPGFWESIGFLIIAGLMVRIGLYIAAFISVIFKSKGVVALFIIGALFGLLGGILPLIMYISYVRLAVSQFV